MAIKPVIGVLSVALVLVLAATLAGYLEKDNIAQQVFKFSSCGDGICDPKELVSSSLCPADCQKREAPVCGDKICQPGENSKNCLTDCPLTSKCGDGVCDAKES